MRNLRDEAFFYRPVSSTAASIASAKLFEHAARSQHLKSPWSESMPDCALLFAMLLPMLIGGTLGGTLGSLFTLVEAYLGIWEGE